MDFQVCQPQKSRVLCHLNAFEIVHSYWVGLVVLIGSVKYTVVSIWICTVPWEGHKSPARTGEVSTVGSQPS